MKCLDGEQSIAVLRELSFELLSKINDTYPCNTPESRSERKAYILAIILIKRKINTLRNQNGLQH